MQSCFSLGCTSFLSPTSDSWDAAPGVGIQTFFVGWLWHAMAMGQGNEGNQGTRKCGHV